MGKCSYVKVCLTTPHSKGLCVHILLIAFTVLVVGSKLFYKTHILSDILFNIQHTLYLTYTLLHKEP